MSSQAAADKHTMNPNQQDSQYPFGMDPSKFKVDQEDMDKFRRRLLRTKTLASASSIDEESGDAPTGGKLERVLTTFDLTSLGVGSCVGTGMYVVAGLVAKNVAGPSAILSFCIAAFASILSGVCYGEFGVRVPKTSGSAYMYSYVTVGEFVAFLIGWNLILEYMIGSAASASALSACFDALIDHKLSIFLESHIGVVIGKTYPDFLGCLICLLMTGVLAVGAKGSVRFNTILNAINLFVWVFIFIAGMVYADGSNWSSSGPGHGFAPYGASGVFSGAATCFYAFIGFDIIATTGEEARSPSRSIPIAIVTSLVICLTAYVSVTMVLTLMVPYYDIHGESSLIDVFVQAGFTDAKYVVAIGALAALTVSLLGSMFPMPRVIYAMSRDGLLFQFLSGVNERTGTPLLATVICGILASLMSLFVGLAILVELMSIGTLLAYTLVSVSVLILRYQPSLHDMPIPMAHRLDPIVESPDQPEEAMVDGEDVFQDPEKRRRQLKDDQGLLNGSAGAPPPKWYGALPFNSESLDSKLAMLKRHGLMLWLRLGFPSDDCMPNQNTAKTTIIFVGFLGLSELATCLLLVFAEGALYRAEVWAVVLLVVSLLAIIACEVVILRQPQNKKKLRFMAPGVPFLPSAAMFINIYLMLKLPALTWARLGIWICLGLLLYFSYSMWHSNKEYKRKTKEEKTSLPPGQTDAAISEPPLEHAGYTQAIDKPLANGTTNHSQYVTSTNQPNGTVATHNMNTSDHKSMTSPPGAPPSRPPPPRQESIEKYLRRSGSSEERIFPKGSVANGYPGRTDKRNEYEAHTDPNHTRNNYRDPTYPTDTTTDSRYGEEYSDEQVPNVRNPPHETDGHLSQNRRSRKMSDDECDPFAQEDREYRNSSKMRAGPTHAQRGNHEMRAGPTQKVTYDKAMARPRPRPQEGKQTQGGLRLNSIESTRLGDGARENEYAGNQW